MNRFLLLANPRTGSTYLANLLRSHPDIGVAGELLNDEHELPDNKLEYIEEQLSKMNQNFVGFKVFPEQILNRKLRFDDIVRYIGANIVVVLWRKSVIEQLISRRIAEKTGIWFSGPEHTNNDTLEKITIDENDLIEYIEVLESDWVTIGSQWPTDVLPIFVTYEDLIIDPIREIRRIFARMSCNTEKYIYVDISGHKKQRHPSTKVENWDQIDEDLKSSELKVDEIITEIINKSLRVEFETLSLVPDREPSMPPNGWRYQVCSPFMPNKAKDNVIDALLSGSVSSAGFWPKQMSQKLRQIFGVPVAQPCSNGFTSLLLAMQAVNIGKGDEVIMPAMTMIAVPNAVHFVGAVPVFVDCDYDNYNPGLKQILDAATDKTRAVVLTHTYGVPAVDLELTVIECKKRGWLLIEDISECVGVTAKTSSGDEKLLGTFGDFACASLYANKIIHAGDGGFVLAKDARLTARLKALVNHGFTPTYHFLHFESAINAKINGLGAALVCGCLHELKSVMTHRHQLSQWYRKHLKSLPIKLMPECGPQDTPWVFGIQCESKEIRTKLRAFLADYGIETRDFFFPLHLQPAFKHICGQKRHFRAEKLGSSGFYLPTYYDLTAEDIEYISSIIRLYFNENRCKNEKQLLSPNQKTNEVVLIKSDSFRVEQRTYGKNGLLKSKHRGHPLIDAVGLNLQAENCLIHERWDQCQELMQNIRQCIKDSEPNHSKSIEKHFKSYMEYFSSQSSFEPSLVRQWLHEDLTTDAYEMANTIATTSDYETLQLLVWLIKHFKPKTVLEFGSWMGHSTALMAIAAQEYSVTHYKIKIYACDAFQWQHWMARFVKKANVMLNGQSFLPRFLHNTQPFREVIEPVVMSYDGSIYDSVKNIRPGLVFIDFTQDCDELEDKWKQIEPLLTPNKTVVLFNGLSDTSIPFFTRHANQLKAIAKPHTIAKAFRFVSFAKIPKIELLRKLNFQTPPDWTHHHKNAFNTVIRLLRDEIHDKSAHILFIPSVEETLCDNPKVLLNNDWIGIIHMVPEYPQLFYTPDLKRLCSKHYSKYMNRCKGLFTLTTFQSEYLRHNLFTKYKIPVQPLTYPYLEPDIVGHSIAVELMKNGSTVDLILIGGFARDYNLFYLAKIPDNIRKVLLIGDQLTKQESKNAPKHVYLQNRLNGDEYENLLQKSIVFLSLKYEGAANTIILECIARNIPILTPNMQSCIEYIGKDYPLLYDTKQTDFTQLITIENIQKSIDYLRAMDKSKFNIKCFINSIQMGCVMRCLPPINSPKDNDLIPNPLFNNFDVTLCICSYKRTHHLTQILNSLWNKQTFRGSFQIIVWNNNESRTRTVGKICDYYSKISTNERSLELISSTRNYFCSIRLAMAQLMQSECLLICDDDIIPGPEFINFFMSAHEKYPKDVLCLRGHSFLPHELRVEDPSNVWSDYENLRFVSDEAPQQLIHFVHADACLIPRKALQECASVQMPDQSFVLVDDYWMSFVLSHRFERKLRKLSTQSLGSSLLKRTEDSDEIGLALYTRPEVKEAKIQLYIHHMLQGWPHWETKQHFDTMFDENTVSNYKQKFWDKLFVGFNISSNLDENDIKDLVKVGVTCVRIGAVGLGDNIDYEFKNFLVEPEVQLKVLAQKCAQLKSYNINVVLTLCRELAKPEIWLLIAQYFRSIDNIVGYDLINEPFTREEESLHWTQLGNEDKYIPELMVNYINIIKTIREVDKWTPIIIESSYWSHIDSLNKLPLKPLLALDSKLMVSFHFYEPMILTQRQKNRNRFSYPEVIPVYDTPQSETILIDEHYIRHKFKAALDWAKSFDVKLVVGEFGISREIVGAEQYLNTIMNVCRDCELSSFIYSFRDNEWDSMDYELGCDVSTGRIKKPWVENELMHTLINGIKLCNSTKNGFISDNLIK